MTEPLDLDALEREAREKPPGWQHYYCLFAALAELRERRREVAEMADQHHAEIEHQGDLWSQREQKLLLDLSRLRERARAMLEMYDGCSDFPGRFPEMDALADELS